MRRIALLLLWLAATTAGAASIQDLRILPANPASGEDFLVEITLDSGFSPITVTGLDIVNSGNVVTLNVSALDGTNPVGGFARARTILNRPAGDYRLFAQVVSGTFVFRRSLDITVAPAATVAPLYRNATGLWWNPAEPGSAVNVTQGDSGQLFALWYTYYPTTTSPGDGSNMWLVMSAGRWTTPTEFRGLLYWARGTPADLPYDASRGQLVPAGLATLRLPSPDRLEFEVDATLGNGLGRIVKRTTLQRYNF